MAYFVQNASVDARTFRFYGVQTVHDHETANKFTKAFKDLLALTFERDKIKVAEFRSNQPSIPTGKNVFQLCWKKGDWTNTDC
jgi:hypothetical protein